VFISCLKVARRPRSTLFPYTTLFRSRWTGLVGGGGHDPLRDEFFAHPECERRDLGQLAQRRAQLCSGASEPALGPPLGLCHAQTAIARHALPTGQGPEHRRKFFHPCIAHHQCGFRFGVRSGNQLFWESQFVQPWSHGFFVPAHPTAPKAFSQFITGVLPISTCPPFTARTPMSARTAWWTTIR